MNNKRWSKFQVQGNAVALLAGDALVLLLALLIGDLIVHWRYGLPLSMHYSLLLLPAWFASALITGLAPGWGLGAVEELRRIEWLLAALFAAAGVAAQLIHAMPSRTVFLFTYLFSALMIPFVRTGVRKLLKKRGRWGCGVALYGDRPTIERMIGIFLQESTVGYQPTAIFSDELEKGSIFEGVPVRGRLRDSTEILSVAVASIAHLRERNLVEFVDHTLADYQKVVLLPELREGVFSWVVPRNLNGVMGLELSRNLLNPFAAWFKRAFETLLVLLFLPFWLPILLLFALPIFLGDGKNPFYLQTRVGRKGKLFKAVKLRTMIPNADTALKQLLEKDAELKAEWDQFYKLKKDPRITPIGRFLRRFSLDELPQLINVLRGEMALVGPRPLPEYHQVELPESARLLRERVLPGMTGQWQVSGRGDCDLSEMELLDSFYVRNWSIWMDLYILARTIRVVLMGHGAY